VEEGSHRLAVREVVETYLADLATRGRRRTVAEARTRLAQVVQGLSVSWVDEITAPLVLRWRAAYVAGGVSNKTANNSVAYLKAALALAVRLGELRAHPLAGLRALPITARHQRRRPRALSEWDLRRLLAAAEELDREGLEDGRRGLVPQAPLVRALVLTGARWGELTAATWSDLDLQRGTLTFREETTKCERERAIPLDFQLVEELARLPELIRRETGRAPASSSRIFLSPKGKSLAQGHSQFWKYLRRVFERAGIPLKDEAGRDVHVHALRHTFCTRLARAGIPIATAQLLTGHRSAEVLLSVYTHLVTEDARQARESLPRVPVASPSLAGGDHSAPREAPSQSDAASVP
jgi:integrase